MKLSDAMFKKFTRLACQLSPENLNCDGEISKAEANRRYHALKAEWRRLEDEVGRSVDESELWGDPRLG